MWREDIICKSRRLNRLTVYISSNWSSINATIWISFSEGELLNNDLTIDQWETNGSVFIWNLRLVEVLHS